MLVDLVDTSVSRQDRDVSIGFERCAHFLAKKRIFAKFRRNDHPRSCQNLLRFLVPGFGIRKLFSIRFRV